MAFSFKHHNPNPNPNPTNIWHKYIDLPFKTREGVCKVKLDMVVSVEFEKQPHSYNEEENLHASHYLKAEKVYPHHRDVCVYLYIGMIPLFRRNNVSCLIRFKFYNIFWGISIHVNFWNKNIFFSLVSLWLLTIMNHFLNFRYEK